MSSSFAMSNQDVWDAVALGSSVHDPKLFQLGEYYKKTGKTKAEAGLDYAGALAFKKAKDGVLGAEAVSSAARAEANAINQNGFMNFATGIGSGLIGGIGKMDFGGAKNYSPTGAPGFGAENVDWMSMPGYFGNPP